MNAKKILRLIMLAGFGLLYSNMYGQQLPGTSLYQHGSNSGGVNANEAIDSVTVGAVMDYYAMPDKTINTSFNETVSLSANITTTFTWDSDNPGESIATKTGQYQNYVEVTWSSLTADTEPDTLFVTEATGTCSDPTPTKIPVRVIAAPTADFDIATNAICENDTVGGYDVVVDLSTPVVTGNIRYTISVQGPNTNPVYTNTYNVNGASNTFTIPGSVFADGRGNYTITFTEISDRISRKSSVAGSSPTQANHVLTLNAQPSTGNIFHLPNR
jgi:hypothetical protein